MNKTVLNLIKEEIIIQNEDIYEKISEILNKESVLRVHLNSFFW